jgi:hypothetical protein
LTTPATVIPCKKCKRRPGYPIDARRRWRGWRRTARILGGSSSGPALSRPPIRARPAQPEARAVFRWRHGALGGVVAKCKGDNPEHHQDGSGYYHQMRKFHWAPHFFIFNPSSTSRRTAAASDGWSFCLAAQFLIRSCISSSRVGLFAEPRRSRHCLMCHARGERDEGRMRVYPLCSAPSRRRRPATIFATQLLNISRDWGASGGKTHRTRSVV